MHETEKSLKLAELMGWDVVRRPQRDERVIISDYGRNLGGNVTLCPYRNTVSGCSQFALILLRFPEVMNEVKDMSMSSETYGIGVEPTQANILDEILRMNDVNIDE